MTNSEIYDRALAKIYNSKDGELFIPRLIINREETSDYEIYYVIFSHEFAKAFWSCDHKCKHYISGSFFDECEKCGAIRPIGMNFNDWKYHLQQMVLEVEPLKYLEKFL